MDTVAFPPLDHLVALSDDTGLFQHAHLDVPNRAAGYCTDDVARGLIVAVDAARRPETAAIGDRLGDVYLAYLLDAQSADGWFHNFLGFDRRWQDDRGSEDSVGRAIWALGVAEERAPRPSWRVNAARMLRRALPRIAELPFPRARAYAILGLARALAARPIDAAPLREALAAAARPLAADLAAQRGDGWVWCEDRLTYDNARIPEALLLAGAALRDERLVEDGLAMLAFLADVTIEDGIFVPVGNDGWYPRGGVKARYGQQPLDAAAMVEAALLALDLSGEARWDEVARTAFDWFRGRNTAQLPVAVGGACHDGIDADGTINANRGGESTLAYLLAASALARRGARPVRLARGAGR